MEELRWKERLRTGIILHHNDVLLGRGGKNNQHIGNQQLRNIARCHVENYRTASKKKKSLISREIVLKIRNLHPSGRFLKWNHCTSAWEDVGDNIAREKASQAMRDAVSSKNACSTSFFGHQHNRNSYASLPMDLRDDIGVLPIPKVPPLPPFQNSSHYGHSLYSIPASGETSQIRQCWSSVSAVVSPDGPKNWRGGHTILQARPPGTELAKSYEPALNRPSQTHNVRQQIYTRHPTQQVFSEQVRAKDPDTEHLKQKSRGGRNEYSRQQNQHFYSGETFFQDQLRYPTQHTVVSIEAGRSQLHEQNVLTKIEHLPCSEDFDLFDGELLKTDLSVAGQSQSEDNSSGS